jgi:RNA polymerase sigma-70 factor, ECF subfamily
VTLAARASQMSRIPTPDEPVASIEQGLAARALAGDERAFRLIYERHAPAVFRFLREQLGNETAADEATQETFVRAHAGLAAIRERDKLAPWLFGIARNVFLEQIRMRKPVAGSDEALEAEPTSTPSPEALLLGVEADEKFAEALAHLSEPRRAALLLQMDHDLSYEEIAEIMDWSLAKVKVEIHRARLQLRAELAKYLGEKS